MYDLLNIAGKNQLREEDSSVGRLLYLPFILDQMNLSLKRANLIIAEHVLIRELNSDTRQILNCSLRESSIIYERIAEKFKPTIPLDLVSLEKGVINKLKLLLGELEGDLPMHAQSIHEVFYFFCILFFKYFIYLDGVTSWTSAKRTIA